MLTVVVFGVCCYGRFVVDDRRCLEFDVLCFLLLLVVVCGVALLFVVCCSSFVNCLVLVVLCSFRCLLRVD